MECERTKENNARVEGYRETRERRNELTDNVLLS